MSQVHGPSEPGTAFEPYRGQVYRWAYRVVGRHHDALDICQDVFLKWWAHLDAAASNPRPWLRQVTVNRAIDVLRQRSMARRERQPLASAGAPAADHVAQQDELRMDVAAVLGALTEAQRSVLVAKVYDGLTFAQVARELEMAVPTAKTHYLRAIRAVRDRLSSRWGPPHMADGADGP